jgi:hypothetical protein
MADTLEITVRAELGWRRLVRPAVDEFGALVAGLGADGNTFVIVRHIPDIPEHFLQAWHEDGGDYVLEYREGGPDRHYATLADGPATVLAAITGWARRETGWASRFDWAVVESEPPEPVPPLDLTDEDTRLLEDRLRLSIVAGYRDRDDLTELAEDYLVTEDRRPVSSAQAARLVDRLWLERVAEQAAWHGETDPERLTRAFAALDAAGITARENFACCHSCGQAEIGAAGREDARGFVYFHEQCTDDAAAGSGLVLYYGGFDGSSDTTASIGHEVVTALVAAGLPARWDGDPGQVIEVRPLDWRKRLTG